MRISDPEAITCNERLKTRIIKLALLFNQFFEQLGAEFIVTMEDNRIRF